MPLQPLKTNPVAYDNFLLAHYERLKHTASVRSRPFLLLLDPSSICQLQCPVCPTGLENAGNVQHGRSFYRRPRKLLSREIFDAVLSELGEVLFFVHLYNWGEPLLNKNLIYFIRELTRHDIAVETNTNLSLPLTDHMVAALVDSGIQRIEASIDGFSQASYGRYRVKGDFALARDNLLRLVAARDRSGSRVELVWNYLVFRFNEAEIDPARRFCEEHGIEFVRREAAVSETLRGEFLPSYREGESLEGFYEQRAKKFDAQTIRSRSELTCGWHYFYSVVNADGSVSPCCAPWESDWDFGRVDPGVVSFMDIWNESPFQRSRQDVAGHRLLDGLTRSGALRSIVTVDDFVRQGTICEGCQMPPAILDLYSSRADLVVSHYGRAVRGKHSERDRAFELVRSQPEAFLRHWEAQSL